MPLLLDNHALIWWSLDLPQLGRGAYAALSAGADEVFVSTISAIEMATKFRLGKLPQAEGLLSDLPGYLEAEGFLDLPLTMDHAPRAGRLPGPHREPFDRMLIAQARAEGLAVVTADAVLAEYGVGWSGLSCQRLNSLCAPACSRTPSARS